MTGEHGGGRRVDWITAGLAFAATACVSVVLGNTFPDHLEVLGISGPFAAYFGGFAWWRARHQAPGPGDAASARSIEELEHRMAALEAEQARVAELEERLDFAERLLARGTEQERIGRGG